MCVDVGETSSANCLHLMADADSSVSEHAIKLRKPYIITKQRERWTEEEHNKFLEALKLYGRAWRRIEEHIGSKTTVQIRSHAQKFFSKVARESSSNCPGSVKAIEIPPPRPKRKPSHPYPRKLGHLSSKKGFVVDEQLWSFVPNQFVSEQESKSPTSVLSVFVSDTIGTIASDTIKPCMSPASSTDRISMADEIFGECGSESRSSSTSAECKGNQSMDPSAVLSMQDISTVELDSDIQDPVTSKEAPVIGQQITSLKLFGRTVIVADLKHQSLSNKNELYDCNDMVLGTQKLQEKGNSESDTFLGEGRGECNPFMAYCSSYYKNLISPVEHNMVSLPSWWALYGGMPSHFKRPLTLLDQSQLHSTDDKFVHSDPTLKESFQTGSSTTSDNNPEEADKSCYESVGQQMKELPPALFLKPSKNSAFCSLRPSSAKSSRGFVPYKRCVVEKKLQCSLVACGKRSS